MAAAKESLAAVRTQYSGAKLEEYQRKILESVDSLRGLMLKATAEAGAVGAIEFAEWLGKAHFPNIADAQLNLLSMTVHTPGGPMAIDPQFAELATPEHKIIAARIDRELAEIDQAARAEAARAA